MEVSELRHATLKLKQRLGDSEAQRIALESDKLRLSLHNITHSPRAPHIPAYPPTSSRHAVMLSQPAVMTSQPDVISSTEQVTIQGGETVATHRTSISQPESQAHIGANLSNACSDITEVNTNKVH